MKANSMLAAVLYGSMDVRMETVPVPAVAAGGVRIAIHTALTCGTDLKVFRRGYHARMIQPPALFGHEVAGIVDCVGPGVTHVSPGDRVVSANSAPCETCLQCLRGRPTLCDDLLFMNGAYAEYITVPQRIARVNLHTISDSVPFNRAALLEPLACVVHGIDQLNIGSNHSVTVIGTGAIGLLFCWMCAQVGASVTAVGRGVERLRLARSLGAEQSITSDALAAAVAQPAHLRPASAGPDFVIECVGQQETWELAISTVGRGGTVCLFGGCPKDSSVQLDPHRVHYDELTLLGAFHHTPDAVRRALTLLTTAPELELLIQRQEPLNRVPELFNELVTTRGPVKVAVHPGHALI